MRQWGTILNDAKRMILGTIHAMASPSDAVCLFTHVSYLIIKPVMIAMKVRSEPSIFFAHNGKKPTRGFSCHYLFTLRFLFLITVIKLLLVFDRLFIHGDDHFERPHDKPPFLHPILHFTTKMSIPFYDILPFPGIKRVTVHL